MSSSMAATSAGAALGTSVVRNDLFEFRAQVSAEACSSRQLYPSSFSNDSSRFVTPSKKNELVIWNLETDDVDNVFTPRLKRIRNAAFQKDGNLFVESRDGVSALRRKKTLWTSVGLSNMSILEDDRILGIHLETSKVRLLTSSDGSLTGEIDLVPFNIEAEVAQSEDDYFVIRSSKTKLAIAKRFDCLIGIWNIDTLSAAREPLELEEEEPMESISISDTHVAVVSTTGALKVFSIGKVGPALFMTEGVSVAEFSPSGRQLLVCNDASAAIWSVAAGVESHGMANPHPDDEEADFPRITLARFNPGGNIVAGVDETSGAVYLWEVEFGTIIGILGDAEGPILSLAFPPQPGRLAGLVEGGTTLVWDLNSGHRERLLALCYHQNKSFVANVKRIKSFLF